MARPQSFIFETDKVKARQQSAHSHYPLRSRSEPIGADFSMEQPLLLQQSIYPCFPGEVRCLCKAAEQGSRSNAYP